MAQERERSSLTHPYQLEVRKTSHLLYLVIEEARRRAQKVNSEGHLKGRANGKWGLPEQAHGPSLFWMPWFPVLFLRALPAGLSLQATGPVCCVLEAAQKPRREEMGPQGAGRDAPRAMLREVCRV